MAVSSSGLGRFREIYLWQEGNGDSNSSAATTILIINHLKHTIMIHFTSAFWAFITLILFLIILLCVISFVGHYPLIFLGIVGGVVLYKLIKTK